MALPFHAFTAPLNHYSSLQTERQYLLTALANEETRAENLIHQLEQTRSKLRDLPEDAPREAIQSLKKTAASLVRRLKRCQRGEKAMVNNLAALTASLQAANNEKWRRAEFQNRQRMQAEQLGLRFNDHAMNGMISPMQAMVLESPVSPMSVVQQGWAAPASPTPYMPSPVPSTPGFVYHNAFGSPLYTPFYETFPTTFMYGQGHPQPPLPQEVFYDPQGAPSQATSAGYSIACQHPQQQSTTEDELGPLENFGSGKKPTLKVRTMSLPDMAGRRSSIWVLNPAERKGHAARRGTTLWPSSWST